MSCHHYWSQEKKDEIITVNGVRATRYFHTCPKCGYKKETVRLIRAMPPEMKWKRELEKLIQRANWSGCHVLYETLTFDINKVLIKPYE